MTPREDGKTASFIRALLRPEEPALIKLRERAADRFIPLLLPETAAFLRQTILLKKPRKIFEIGTAIGYSGALMLSASEARLFTVEADDDLIAEARKTFSELNFSPRVTLFGADANEIVPLMWGEFDFIFMDGPKTRYVEYYPYLKKLLVPGGVLFCDNVLFGGMVAGERPAGKKRSIAEKLGLFLKTLLADDDLVSSVLSVGDGVSLSIKKL